MRILLIIDQFENGGAARVASVMCNEFKARAHEIIVVTETQRSKIKYDLNVEIPLLYATFKSRKRGGLSRLLCFFSSIRSISRHLKGQEPDVVIAIQANAYVRTFFANIGLHYPLIVADHTSFSRRMDAINTFTRHFLYKYADGISILTNRDAKLIGDKYPQKMVIHNPLAWETLSSKTERKKTVLAVGRFDIWRIKGFDILLEIWGHIAPDFPEWSLNIAGTGSGESIAAIKDMISHNGVENSVTLLGQISDMKALYKCSGIFVLSSRIEGMPMALLEAMSQGCPSVSFDVGGASSEMLESGGGIIVKDGDVEGFRKALVCLMLDDNRRRKMSELAIESASKFSVDSFVYKWAQLINKSVNK